jgi:hypothetical protein
MNPLEIHFPHLGEVLVYGIIAIAAVSVIVLFLHARANASRD